MENKTQIPMPFFCQADERWAKRLLTNESFRKSGCFVTCCAMLVSYTLGKIIYPNELDEWLDKNKGYDGNLLIPTKVSEYVKENGGLWQPQHFVRLDMTKIKLIKSSNGYVPAIGRVKTKIGSTHFVVLLNEDGLINDPGHFKGANMTIAKQNYSLNRIYYF